MPLVKKQYGVNPSHLTKGAPLAIKRGQITIAAVKRVLTNWQTRRVAGFKNIPQTSGE